jgi:hypothetical protein
MFSADHPSRSTNSRWLVRLNLPDKPLQHDLNDIEEIRRNSKRYHPAHQTFTGADDLSHAIHDAVVKFNMERRHRPLGSQRIVA